MKCIYWSVGFECIECGAEGETQEDAARYLNATVAINVLKDADLIKEAGDRPRCKECNDVVTVWWNGVESHFDEDIY